MTVFIDCSYFVGYFSAAAITSNKSGIFSAMLLANSIILPSESLSLPPDTICDWVKMAPLNSCAKEKKQF